MFYLRPVCVCVCVRGEIDLLTCPYPLKVWACPPRDQRPALRSGVSGQEEPRSYIVKLFIGDSNVSTTNEMVKNLSTTDFTCSTGWLTGLKNSRIDPLWWTHRAISRSSQCSITGVTKAVVCAILYMGWCIKEPMLLIGKSSPCGGSEFPLSLSELSFTICLTPYNRK